MKLYLVLAVLVCVFLVVQAQAPKDGDKDGKDGGGKGGKAMGGKRLKPRTKPSKEARFKPDKETEGIGKQISLGLATLKVLRRGGVIQVWKDLDAENCSKAQEPVADDETPAGEEKPRGCAAKPTKCGLRRIYEVDASGAAVTADGHSYAKFKDADVNCDEISETEIEVPNSKKKDETNGEIGTDPIMAVGTSCTLGPLGSTNASIEFNVYLLKNDGEIRNGDDEQVPVVQNSVKASLEVVGWTFDNAANSLVIEYACGSGKGKPKKGAGAKTGKKRGQEFKIGDDEAAVILSEKVKNSDTPDAQGEWMDVKEVKSEEKGGENLFSVQIPSFANGGKAFYDPSILPGNEEATDIDSASGTICGSLTTLVVVLTAMILAY